MTFKYDATSFLFVRYDDIITKKQCEAVMENEVEAIILYFDPKTIDWNDYFMCIHIPSVVKYVF